MLRFRLTLNPKQKDTIRVIGLSLGYILTALIPRRIDSWLVARISSFYLMCRPSSTQRLARKMEEVLSSNTLETDFQESAANFRRMMFENLWSRVRGMHLGKWEPQIQVEGLHRLEEALAYGNGVILWRMACCSTPVGKRGLWEAGIPIVHLSQEYHGALSESPGVANHINTLYRRAEDPYLKERIVIPSKGGGRYMKTLIDRLNENAVVSIFGEHSSAHSCVVPFFNIQVEYATGAPSLAHKTGAVLLPVHVVREGDSFYRVVIEKPIELDRSISRKVFVVAAVKEFSRRLEQAVLNSPESWNKWKSLLAEDPRYRPAESIVATCKSDSN